MQIVKFKNILETEREQLILRAQLSAKQEIDCSGDEVDQIQSGILVSATNRLLERDQLKLQRIDLALKKIQEGSFGECAACGDEIGEKRLLVSPILNLCVSCAEGVELAKKKGLH